MLVASLQPFSQRTMQAISIPCPFALSKSFAHYRGSTTITIFVTLVLNKTPLSGRAQEISPDLQRMLQMGFGSPIPPLSHLSVSSHLPTPLPCPYLVPPLVQGMLTLVLGSNMDFWPVLYKNVCLALPLGIQWCKMGYKYRLFRNWAEISFVGYQKMLYFLFPFILLPH